MTSLVGVEVDRVWASMARRGVCGHWLVDLVALVYTLVCFRHLGPLHQVWSPAGGSPDVSEMRFVNLTFVPSRVEAWLEVPHDAEVASLLEAEGVAVMPRFACEASLTEPLQSSLKLVLQQYLVRNRI